MVILPSKFLYTHSYFAWNDDGGSSLDSIHRSSGSEFVPASGFSSDTSSGILCTCEGGLLLGKSGGDQAQPIEILHPSRGSETARKLTSKNAAASYLSPSLWLDHSKLNRQVFQIFDEDRSCRTLLAMLFGAVAMNVRRVVRA